MLGKCENGRKDESNGFGKPRKRTTS